MASGINKNVCFRLSKYLHENFLAKKKKNFIKQVSNNNYIGKAKTKLVLTPVDIRPVTEADFQFIILSIRRYYFLRRMRIFNTSKLFKKKIGLLINFLLNIHTEHI